MRRRRLPIVLVASCASLLGTAPAAPAFGPGETFLTGGLDLPAGAVAGGASGHDGTQLASVSVSDDGRYLAFVSRADTLDAAAHPDVANVFRKDRDTGEVVLVSRASGAAGAGAAANSTSPVISDDGRRVAFLTSAALTADDTDGGMRDVYVRDVAAGTTMLASRGEGSRQTTTHVSSRFDLSGGGRYVAFGTADALGGAFDVNGVDDVYRWDLVTNRLVLVTISARVLGAANDASLEPSISDDGAWVAFASRATDLATDYTPGTTWQVWVRDLAASRSALVSNDSGSLTRGANGESHEPDVAGAPGSGDAVVVVYTTEATNVVDPDDTDPDESVIHRRLRDATSTLVSRATGVGGASAGADAAEPSVSDDGNVVTFRTGATNLGAGAQIAVYVRRVAQATTQRVSAAGVTGARGSLSGDGTYVAWTSELGITGDSDPDYSGVFGRAYDPSSDVLEATELISRPPGTQSFLGTWIAVQESAMGPRTISGDGRYIVFRSGTSRLPGAAEGGIYRRDTLTGAVELVSRANGPAGAPATGVLDRPTISADGSRVAFLSSSSLDPAHTTSDDQLYVRDVAAGTTTLASRADGAGGAAADDDVVDPAIGADGTHVAFATQAANLGDPAGVQHVYLRDLAGATTRVVDRVGFDGALGDDSAELPSLSADGRLVAFGSQADNLHPDDTDRLADVFVRDMATGVITLASRRSGLAGAKATGMTWGPSLSADGSVIAFQPEDESLAPEAGGWNGRRQIVARTLATGENVLVSRAPGGVPANAEAADASVSGDGTVVAFESAATNLLPGVGGGTRTAVLARDLTAGVLSGPPAFGLLGNAPSPRAVAPSISQDGQCLSFAARGHNAISGPAGDFLSTYIHVVSGVCPKPLPAPPPVARRAVRASALRARMTRKRFRVGRARTARVAGAAALRLEARAAARRGARRGKRKACKRRGAARRKACKPRGRRAKAGTAFLVTLTERANVGIAIERQAEGRLVGRFCRKPRPRLRRNLRCIRFAKVGSLSRRGVRAGRTRIAFSGRIGKRALKPGKYRVRVRASNAGGTSRWVRLRFRVVRR